MSQTNNNDRQFTILICTFAIIFGIVFKLMPSYFYWQGQKEYNKQEYAKAHKYLKNAYKINKRNKDYRYFYVKTLTHLKPTLIVQKEIFELASSSQKDSAQQIAERTITNWRNNIISYIGDNYIEQVPLDKGIIRWDASKFPLKIAIINTSQSGIPSYYNNEILKAFAQWQATTNFITFDTTNSTKEANIIIKISDPPGNLCSEKNCKYVVGYTTPTYKDSTLYNMTIILYSKDPFGNFFSDKELYNTILHEIGHALGIMGHSYSSEDLMYMATDNDSNFYAPYRSSFQYLPSKDINTIKLLYKMFPDISNTPIEELDTKGQIYAPIILGTSNQISLRKLKEAQNYVKNAPNIAGGYIDMGIAYAELNKYKDAIKALEKGYELATSDNEKYLILYNMSAIYMNTKKYDKAMEYAQQAKQLYDCDEIKELIMNIKHAKLTKK